MDYKFFDELDMELVGKEFDDFLVDDSDYELEVISYLRDDLIDYYGELIKEFNRGN